MQSEKLIRKAAEAIWAIRREEEDRCDMSLDDMGGEESSVWQEAKAALEAALSTDAEPVKTAPAVAVKAKPDADDYLISTLESLVEDNVWSGWAIKQAIEIIRSIKDDLPYHCDACSTHGHGDAPCSPLCDRPALSAQVQDVAVPEAKPEKKVEPDRSKFPYVWEGPKPDEAIIHQVINAYMGAQEREYDIDQFRYYKANWHWHYTINQHMKAAVDAASRASKHGDAE